ncbi:sulfotransferase domain-containing protein [Sphingobium sp.]|uniref:sulfotransferase domain-containing protein n=1 Tax=Sphingobium sp. TaxID=1912891 RepID=UPI002B8B4D51|nr:sulfotransferase domain-containing protein [Sphingobium sp.]HUD93127.1 sulfotransferase domain-containing protein [Sphingobium sp.]
MKSPALLARRMSAARSLRLASCAASALLASYPKSGRTWLRFILAQYFLASREVSPITTRTMFDFAPNFDLDPVRGIPAFIRRSEEAALPLVPSTHLRYSPMLPSHLPVIFLIRDPRGALNSHYHHVTRHKKSFTGGMDDFLTDAHVGIPHYARYMNSWGWGLSRHRHHILFYEDLIADTAAEMRKLLHFLGEQVDEQALAIAVERSSFDRMRALEIAEGIPGHSYDRSDADALRMRKGQADSFRKEMTRAQQICVEEGCRTALNRRILPKMAHYDFARPHRAPTIGADGRSTSPARRSMGNGHANLAIQLLAEALVVFGLAAMLIAPPILAIEVGEWLFQREWEWGGRSVEDGLALFGIDRPGTIETPTDRIVDVLLALPLTMTLFMTGLMILLVGVHMGDWGVQGVRLKNSLAIRRRKSRHRRSV